MNDSFLKFMKLINSAGSASQLSQKNPNPPKLENVKNQFFPRPPHPPKVETVKNQFFQDHHTCIEIMPYNDDDDYTTFFKPPDMSAGQYKCGLFI